MARTLESIVRTVHGRLVGDPRPLGTRVDAILPLGDFHTPGDPHSLTLVAGEPDGLRRRAREGGLDGVAGVTTDDGGSWAEVEAAGATVIVAPEGGGPSEMLLHRIAAVLASDRAAEDRMVTLGTRVLTQVARRGGAAAVVAELAHRIDGWAVLLDAEGQPIATAGAGSLHVQDAVALALQRKVRVRHPGLQVHPVGEAERPNAFLVVSSRDATASGSRDLAAQAGALLDLVLRTHDHTVTERLGRELVMTTLFAAPPADARGLLRRWGARDAAHVAFVLSSRTRDADLDGLVTQWLDELALPHLVSSERGVLTGLVPADQADELARRIVAVASETRAPLRCGIGTASGVDGLARSLAEARQAHDVALAGVRPAVRYEALPTVRYLLDTLGVDQTRHLAVLLDGLRETDGTHGALFETLRVFLAENGAWGVTAARLGVHRQTLAARIRRVEELTGLSMADADDRAAAWLAIRATEPRAQSLSTARA